MLGLGRLTRAQAPPAAAAALPAYGDWRDVYRERWRWDKVVHSSHARANCISTCSWNVFVKDGVAWREEQNAIYAAAEGVPDFNPRGCQKGACYTDLMYEASRVTHPLRRVGEQAVLRRHPRPGIVREQGARGLAAAQPPGRAAYCVFARFLVRYLPKTDSPPGPVWRPLRGLREAPPMARNASSEQRETDEQTNGPPEGQARRGLALLFPGQGSQHSGMGKRIA